MGRKRNKLNVVISVLLLCFLLFLILSASATQNNNNQKKLLKRSPSTETFKNPDNTYTTTIYPSQINVESNNTIIPFEEFLNFSEDKTKMTFTLVDGSECDIKMDYKLKDNKEVPKEEYKINKKKGSYYFTTDIDKEVTSMDYKISCDSDFIDDTLYILDGRIKIDFSYAKDLQNITATHEKKNKKLRFSITSGKTGKINFIDPLVTLNSSNTTTFRAYEDLTQDSPPPINTLPPGTVVEHSSTEYSRIQSSDDSRDSIGADNAEFYIIHNSTFSESYGTITLINWTWEGYFNEQGDTNTGWTAFYVWNFTGTAWVGCSNNVTDSSTDTIRNCEISDSTLDYLGSDNRTYFLVYGTDPDDDDVLQNDIFTDFVKLEITYTTNIEVELSLPKNNSQSSADVTFECNQTSSSTAPLVNVTLYIWNSTDVVNSTETSIITGSSNSTQFNITLPTTDTYQWNCLAFNNESFSDWADSNFTLNADTENTAINLEVPSNNSWFNSLISNISLNFTPSHSTQTVETCQLWTNWNGTWHNNLTITSAAEDSINEFSQNLTGISDASYIWSVSCNTTTSAAQAFTGAGNYTFSVDTVLPNSSIDPIEITQGSQTVTFNSNATDINTITCKYAIYNSTGDIDGLNNNVSYTCNNPKQATVTAFSTYNLTITATDLAGNENSTSLNFTTIEAQSGEGGGGGGGAGVETIPVIGLLPPEELTRDYNDFEREVIYSRINTGCSVKEESRPLAIQDFSGECSLTLLDISEIVRKLSLIGVSVPQDDLIEFFKFYSDGKLFQGFETRELIEEWGLFTSVLGLTNPMKINPPSWRAPVFMLEDVTESRTIERIFTVNKDIRECIVIEGNGDINCTLVSNTSFQVSYFLENVDFFDELFEGKVSVTSKASADNLEVREVPIALTVYNFKKEFIGLPFWALILISIILLTIIILLVVNQRRIRKWIKRR